jgi:hypothetical protein
MEGIFGLFIALIEDALERFWPGKPPDESG